MIRRLSDVSQFYVNVQLFSDDIALLADVLAQDGRRVVIHVDEWELDGAHEVPAVAARLTTTEYLYIGSAPPDDKGGFAVTDIMLTIKEGKGHLSGFNPTPALRGLVAEVNDVLARCKVPGGESPLWLWQKQPWDTIILQPRPVEVRIAQRLEPPKALPLPPVPEPVAVSNLAEVPVVEVKPEETEKLKSKANMAHETVMAASKAAGDGIGKGVAAGLIVLGAKALRWLHIIP